MTVENNLYKRNKKLLTNQTTNAIIKLQKEKKRGKQNGYLLNHNYF